MLFLFVIHTVGCVVLLVAGVVEQRRHDHALETIPARVVVNGIRGKSSITRLCAGALRGGGLTTVAKTTGTAARFIDPDGVDEPVYRRFGLANVVEQIGIVRRAAAHRPDVLVMECMAVMPELQELNQRKLVRGTVVVISNVREDHLAEMGPTLPDIARSLCRSMPVGGVCITAERELAPILREEATRRDCRLVEVDPESVSDAEIARFDWITFKDNVAIGLEVARLQGVDRDTALDGMVEAPPDPGVVRVERRRTGDDTLSFANVFAANDPASTRINIAMLAERGLLPGPLSIVINCRADRQERNGQMGALCTELDPQRIVLVGERTHSARTAVDDALRDRVVDLGGPLDLDAVLAACPRDDGACSLVAVGNIHGCGEELLHGVATLPAAPAPLITTTGGAPCSRGSWRPRWPCCRWPSG